MKTKGDRENLTWQKKRVRTIKPPCGSPRERTGSRAGRIEEKGDCRGGGALLKKERGVPGKISRGGKFAVQPIVSIEVIISGS